MPELKIEGLGSYTVSENKRLLNALIEDAATDQLHACGGKGKCTTCRVEFVSGEPQKMTQQEKTMLKERGLEGVRLSCQLLCDQDMEVRVISRLEGSGRADAGTLPGDTIEPDPEWVTKDE